MARAQGARAQMALAFESSYGTAPAAGAFWQMPFTSCNLGSEQNLLASELLGYGRDPVAPVGDAINVDGNITVPIDARFFGVWLKAIFGALITTGPTAGVYTHVFQFGGWTPPSLAIEIGMPDVPFFWHWSWRLPPTARSAASLGIILSYATSNPRWPTGAYTPDPPVYPRCA